MQQDYQGTLMLHKEAGLTFEEADNIEEDVIIQDKLPKAVVIQIYWQRRR